MILTWPGHVGSCTKNVLFHCWGLKHVKTYSIYRTRAIISRGLYFFYPISKDHFFVFKEVFSENSVLMYGLYSRAASNQERLMMARVRLPISEYNIWSVTPLYTLLSHHLIYIDYMFTRYVN